MLQINQLLARFKNLTNTNKAKKEVIIEIFKKNGIPVTLQQVSILKNTIITKTQPIIKTEILLKKETIISQIKEIHSFANILDIQ